MIVAGTLTNKMAPALRKVSDIAQHYAWFEEDKHLPTCKTRGRTATTNMILYAPTSCDVCQVVWSAPFPVYTHAL
jgi:hypothetical protein